MGQLVVRGVDDRRVAALKRRAATAGRSMEQLHREIREAALALDLEDFATAAARMRGRTAASATDSAAIVRADRDRDATGAGG